jgi:hypothetical protein
MHTPCARLPITGPRLGPRRRSGTGYRAPGARYLGPGTGYLNARPKTQAECLDHAPKCSVENLMGVGMPSTHGEEPSEFPLEDRSDRLGDPPSTVFPAGDAPSPGPTAEATETGSRGRPEPPGHRWPGAGPPRPSTTSGTASPADDAPCASWSRGWPGVGKSPSPPAGNASGTVAGSSPGPPSATWGSPDAA